VLRSLGASSGAFSGSLKSGVRPLQSKTLARRVGHRRSTATTDVSTSAFTRFRRDKQVIDISSGMTKSCVVSTLISRRLRRKPRVFDPFLIHKGVDFSPLTKILPVFLKSKTDQDEDYD
jgi:hypothetical protein